MRPMKRQRHPVDSGSGSDSDGDYVSDLKQIVCLLRLIKAGANKEGQKMCEQAIASVAADIQTMLEDTKLKFEKESVAADIQTMLEDTKLKFEKESVAADIQTMLEDTKLKFEKERQNMLKVLSNTSKECEISLNEEYTKLQETYEMFCEEKDAHLQTFKDLFSQVEVEKKKLLEHYEHYRKEETATLSELGDTFSEKIMDAKPSPKRMKQDDKSFIIFRKSIGSFLECISDDDFDLDNE